MQSIDIKWMAALLLFFATITMEMGGALFGNTLSCTKRWSPCHHRVIRCPDERPYVRLKNPNAKACFLNCYSPKCKAMCRVRKPVCDGLGFGCHDPRFIGADGTMFYIHGRKGKYFSLVSDPNPQINQSELACRSPASWKRGKRAQCPDGC